MKFCDRLKNLLHGRRDTTSGSFAKAFRNSETLSADEYTGPDMLCILLIRGKPNPIVGLDEGRFCSAHGTPRPDSLYVMSEAAFRTFLPIAV